MTVAAEPFPVERPEALGLHDAILGQVAAGRDDVAFFGDSITDRFLNGVGAAVWWNELAPIGAADFSVPADLAANLLWRVENGEVAGRPKAAVVEIGTNNLAIGDSVAYTEWTIEVIVQAITALSPSTRVILMGILPRGTPTDPIRQEIAQVNADLAAWAVRQPGLTFVDIGPELTAPDGSIAADFLPDLVHPNAVGYQIWTDAIAGPLQQILV